jgi:hypothetical protein
LPVPQQPVYGGGAEAGHVLAGGASLAPVSSDESAAASVPASPLEPPELAEVPELEVAPLPLELVALPPELAALPPELPSRLLPPPSTASAPVPTTSRPHATNANGTSNIRRRAALTSRSIALTRLGRGVSVACTAPPMRNVTPQLASSASIFFHPR